VIRQLVSGFRCAIAGFLRFGSTFEVQSPRHSLSLPCRASSGELLLLLVLGVGCLLCSVRLDLDNGIGWDCLTSLAHRSEVAPIIPPQFGLACGVSNQPSIQTRFLLDVMEEYERQDASHWE